MHFQRLRLSGFKSFIDPTDFRIEPGLTGIVGPNGCGKSNLLEALRWVMGANSAKAMRAEGMDDVIFAGNSSRASRNHAEVVLTIDNAARRAPAQFNDHAVLEVSRRIDRGEGSTYRINGREVRALQYTSAEGDPRLRQQIGAMLGVPAARIVVVTGSQQGIDLAARVLLDPGDVAVVEGGEGDGALPVAGVLRGHWPAPLACFGRGCWARWRVRSRPCLAVAGWRRVAHSWQARGSWLVIACPRSRRRGRGGGCGRSR